MRKISLSLLALMMIGFSACSDNDANDSTERAENANEQKMDNPNSPGTQADADFAVKAANGGMMEVQLGQLAQDNASSPDVKQFGQQMVTDHSKANDELKALAAQKNITLPQTVGGDKAEKINELQQKHGRDFDEAYIDFMVKDHKEDIDEFQNEANTGADPDIKNWASGKVPTLQQHLDMAQNIQNKMK